MTVERRRLHADPDRDVAQREAGQAVLVGTVPGGREDLPASRLTSFG